MKERIGKLNNGFVLRCARSPHQAHLGALASTNPFRFSCEYAEDDTATIYYNYRHYEPAMGKWLSRDPIEELGSLDIYAFVNNSPVDRADAFGLVPAIPPALAKCVADVILNQINGFFSDYFTKARMCNKAGSDVLASLESIVLCKPGSFKYSNTPGDRPSSYKASTMQASFL